MKVRACIRNVGETTTWNEQWDIPRDGESAAAVIENFNKSLRQGEKARELIDWAPITVDTRDDVEALFIGHTENIVFPVDRIYEILANPSGALMTFLNSASVGEVFDISDEMDCHFNFAVLILAGGGDQLGLTVDLPTTEAEDCEECGADSSNMAWEDGGWKCGSCGSIQ